MNRIFSLYSVLTKNAEMRVPNKGKKGRMYMSLAIIALSCIMIPCCIIVGFVSYIMTEALIAAEAPSANGILAEMHIMSAFSVVFGMLVIFNILFFSSDREHLVPMPFKAWEIMMAKFFYAYLAESVMEFMILISMFIGFFVANGVTIVGVLCGVVGVILIPLIPLAYCAVIGLLMLVCLRGVKNSKIFDHASTIMLVIFLGLFLYSFRGMGSITVENYINSIADGANVFTNVLNKIFFTIPMLSTALSEANILMLLLFIIGNVAVVCILAIIGRFTYQEALYTVARLGNGRAKSTGKDNYNKEQSVFLSYFKKEIKVLTRTRAYNGNCVVINFLWPLLVGGYLYWNNGKEGLEHLKELFAMGYERTYLLLTLGIIMLSFIASAMNSLASTAFTREGLHIDFIKYIPVSYKTQALVKALISVVISFPALLITDIILCVYFRLSIVWAIILAVIIILCLVITTALGMYLDSSHPHIAWEDEYSALRGNLNTFFDMALIMVISGIVCGISFLLNAIFKVPVVLDIVITATVLLVMAILGGTRGLTKTIENMEEL